MFSPEQFAAMAKMAGIADAGMPSPSDMANASHFWEFLDEMAQRDPKEYEAFLKKQTGEFQANTQRKMPAPGFCVLLRLRDRTPLFVNLCSHQNMKGPGSTPDGSVPLAVGVPRKVVHDEKPGYAADVVFAEEVTAKAATDASFREEIAALAVTCVKETLSERELLPSPLLPGYRVLPVRELRYAGKVAPFVDARADPQPPQGQSDAAKNGELSTASLLRTVREEATALGGVSQGTGCGEAGSLAQGLRVPGKAAGEAAGGQSGSGIGEGARRVMVEELNSMDAEPETPEYELRQESAAILLRVRLPRVRAASELDVKVGEQAASLSVEGVYSLSVEMPAAVRSEEARCKFDKMKRTLTVTMPLAECAL